MRPIVKGPHRPRVGGATDWLLTKSIRRNSLPTGPVRVEAVTEGYEQRFADSFQSLVPPARGRWRP